MDIQDIKELMKEMSRTGVSFLEIESEGTRLRLKRASWSQAGRAEGEGHEARLETTHSASPCEASETQNEPAGVIITSPTVGIFYSAPSPEGDPFVSLGSAVEKGQPLCIIEAMKLMNEVTSPCDGVILEIFPENGQRVEFGQPLLRIGGV